MSDRTKQLMEKIRATCDEFPEFHVCSAVVGGPNIGVDGGIGEIAGMVMLSKERGLGFDEMVILIQTALQTMATVSEECEGLTLARDLRFFSDEVERRSGVGIAHSVVAMN